MYNLSYVLTTYNKCNFLKVSLNFLINTISKDEEIIVIDGGSTDGTKDYLEDLFKNNKIHQLVSESDCGESHALNKGILLSRGQLIKLITDDDCFNLKAIRSCKDYMMKHEDVDLLIGTTLNVQMEDFSTLSFQDSTRNSFFNWVKNKNCFTFTGLSIMLRRDSLPLLGLLNPVTKFPDTEFSLRVTSLPIKLVWCETPVVIRIDNYKSNLRNYSNSLISLEGDRIQYFYDSSYRQFHKFNLIKSYFSNLKKLIRNMVNSILTRKDYTSTSSTNYRQQNFPEFFERCLRYFSDYDGEENFICE